jgi:3-hydroxyisobutyrate dehydrogenase-like beta-hydroxyacid dehydrogenase
MTRAFRSLPIAERQPKIGAEQEHETIAIGFIGLGRMGAAIAGNLVRAGHDVKVWNRSTDKTGPLVKIAARRAETPAGAAAGKVVFTMLANDEAVERVVFGDDGVLASTARPIHVSMSTISVALAERLTEAHEASGGDYISAPVFGRPSAAEAGKLAMVTAGGEKALAVCDPLFAVVGQRTFKVGAAPKMANVWEFHDHGGDRIFGRGDDARREKRRRQGRAA